MIRMILSAVLLVLLTLAPPAMAVSFDCAKATTPLEHAICDDPTLSAADDVLAKAFATATGGLTKPSVAAMRADQRQWLDFSQRACTDTAEPLTTGSYNAEQIECLAGQFKSRATDLEDSRMLGGHRFYLLSRFAAVPDPDGISDPDYFWKVATHEVSWPLLDEDDPLAADFNIFMATASSAQSDLLDAAGGSDLAGADPQSDTDVTIAVSQAISGRITMTVNSYWYGHGAAHGNWGISHLHYLTGEKRELTAADVFTGQGWEKKLLDLAVAQLKAEHGDWLMLDDTKFIADVVTQPSRWSFDSDYGLIMQFEPYEVAAYAYGAPTITIPWDDLEEIKAENADKVRYGF
jgi:uncharacterized protein